MPTYFCPRHGIQPTKPCPLCGDRLRGSQGVKLRAKVKRRYAYRCAAYTAAGTRCMVHAPLEVHHVDGDHGNNDPRNLVPLCHEHHVLFAHARAEEFAEPEQPMVR
jgi:hypothetical protein